MCLPCAIYGIVCIKTKKTSLLQFRHAPFLGVLEVVTNREPVMDYSNIVHANRQFLSGLLPGNCGHFFVSTGRAVIGYGALSNDPVIQGIISDAAHRFPVLEISRSLRVVSKVTHDNVTQSMVQNSALRQIYVLSYAVQDGTTTTLYPIIISTRSMSNFSTSEDVTETFDEYIEFDIEYTNGTVVARLLADIDPPSSLAAIAANEDAVTKSSFETVSSEKLFSGISSSRRMEGFANDGVLLSDADITLFSGNVNLGNGSFVMTSTRTRSSSITLDPCTNDTPWVGVSDVLTDSDGNDFCFVVIDTTKTYQLSSTSAALSEQDNVSVLTQHRHTLVILIRNGYRPESYEIPISDTPNKLNYTITLKNRITLHPSLQNGEVNSFKAIRLPNQQHYSIGKGRGWKCIFLDSAASSASNINWFITLWGWNPAHERLIRAYCVMQELLEIESDFHAFLQNFSVLAVVTRNDSTLLIKNASVGKDTDSPVNGEFICVSHGTVYKSQCAYSKTTHLWTDANGEEETPYYVDISFSDTVWYVSDRLSWKADRIVFDPLIPTTKSGNNLNDPPEIYYPVVYGETVRRSGVVGYTIAANENNLCIYAMTIENNAIARHEIRRMCSDTLEGTAKVFAVLQWEIGGVLPEAVTITDGYSVLPSSEEVTDSGTNMTYTQTVLSFLRLMSGTDRNFVPFLRHAFVSYCLYNANATDTCTEMTRKEYYAKIENDATDEDAFCVNITPVIQELETIVSAMSGTETGTSGTETGTSGTETGTSTSGTGTSGTETGTSGTSGTGTSASSTNMAAFIMVSII